ncbi:MAG TPA: cyclodeaminase/cyclohydrolase family protein [Candidatus Limnocylindria bacterium]|nr:cyclodeaminase/cyclohydrolase family protein [Candidatus Limnocylindria bacterium]
MELQNVTLAELTERIAEKSPAPGGGSSAAAAGALAAALVCMVARLTDGKPGYESIGSRAGEILARGEELRRQLLENVQKDAESYEGYREALRLPKDTEEQKAHRQGTMEETLKDACNVPMDIAKASLEALALAKELVEGGLAQAASDSMVAVLLARAAVLGAAGNIRLNLRDIRDTQFNTKMETDCEALERQANEAEHEADALLRKRIKGEG